MPRWCRVPTSGAGGEVELDAGDSVRILIIVKFRAIVGDCRLEPVALVQPKAWVVTRSGIRLLRTC